MTTVRSLLVSSVLPAVFVLGAPPLALSQDAPPSAGPAVELAQKSDDADEKDGRRKGKREHDGEDRRKGASKDDAPEADRERKRKDVNQGEEKSFKQKQDVDRGRQDGFKQKQLQEQQAKEKALKQKQEADRTRQDAFKQKQLQEQQAKEKALKQKQEADRARQDAFKQKQLQEQQAKEKALKQKQEADRTRKDRQAPTKFDRAKADQEFERARKDAQQKGGPAEPWRPAAATKFEELRKGRKTREVGSRDIITEPDKRVIVRDEKRTIIRHDETARLTRKGGEVRRERRKDGTWLVITAGLAGALIHSILDDDGRVIRRSRRDRDGREYVLFDDRRHYRSRGHGPDYAPIYIDLPPPVVRIPRDRYIVEYDRASFDDIYEALDAPPIEDLDRGYSLDEIRYNYSILERMRRVDLDAITFAFGSWEVEEGQYTKLERIARAMHRVLDRSPNELFLIEGHTDAVGNDIDNLSLSDRRAEMVAAILTDTFDIPPENLTTQGYGETHLKELTDGPSRINRRVAVRRITPLLSREGWDDPA